MNKSIIAVLIVIILGLGAYIFWTRTGSGVQPTTATSTTETTPTLTEATKKAETSEYKIDAKYPQFGVASVDAKITSVIDTAMAAFKEYPVNPPEFGLPKNEQTITYDTTYIGPDVISAELLVSEYTGGAHPNTVIIGVNVDPRSGKEVTIDDAIKMTGMSLPQIAAASLSQLKARLGADVIFPEGADPKKENYQTFLISKDKVTFVFQNYQVAPYAAGPQEVAFPRR